MKYLIVSADDLGLTKTINEGIIKAYKEGIVTAVNVIPSGEAFEDALRLIRDNKIEEAGAHLALTETEPVADPADVPTLITNDGRFYKGHNQFFLNFFLNRIDRSQIYTELKAQLARLKNAGIKAVSLSSHEHIHMAPDILNMLVTLAKEYHIRSIRHLHRDGAILKFDPKRFYKKAILAYFDKPATDILKKNQIIYADDFLGFLDSGELDEETLIRMIKSLKDGVTELVCHPGFLGPEVLMRYKFHVDCERELFALTSPRVKKTLEANNVQLTSYGQFLAISPDR